MQRVEENKNEAWVTDDASEPPRTRCRLRKEEDQSSPSINSDIAFAESSLKRPKFDGTFSSQICLKEEKLQPPQPCIREKNVELVSTQSHVRDTRSESVPQKTYLREQISLPASPHVGRREKRPVSRKLSNNNLKEAEIEPGVGLLLNDVHDHPSNTLIKPKSEPFTGEFPQDEVPINVNHPPKQHCIRKEGMLHFSWYLFC